MPTLHEKQRGFVPILVVIAAIVAISAGAGYAVKNNLVSFKEGKVVLNQTKDGAETGTSPDKSNSIQNPVDNVANAIIYKSDTPNSNEPQFSFTPPSGWINKGGQGKVKLFYEAPQEDKKVIGDSTSRSTANIQITSEKSSAKSLDEVMAKLKKEAGTSSVKIEFYNEQKTTFAGHDAIVYEASVSLPEMSDAQIKEKLKKAGNQSSVEDVRNLINQKVRGLGFILLKDGYEVGFGGAALASFWDTRGPQIDSSMKSFKFIENTKPDESTTSQQNSTKSSPTPSGLTGLARFPDYSPAQKGEFSYDPSSWIIQQSSGKAFPKFKLNILPDWMQKISEYKEDMGFQMSLRPIDYNPDSQNPNTLDQAVVLITIRKDTHTSAEQYVIDTFGRSQIRQFRKYDVVTNNGYEGRYLEQDGGSTILAEYIYLINGFSINISATAPSDLWKQIAPSLKQTINSFVFQN